MSNDERAPGTRPVSDESRTTTNTDVVTAAPLAGGRELVDAVPREWRDLPRIRGHSAGRVRGMFGVLCRFHALRLGMGRQPRRTEYVGHGWEQPYDFEKYFGRWGGLVEAAGCAPAKYANRKPEALAPLPKPVAHGTLFGDALDYRAMRHEPVNEQGVVLLFGMMAEDLGFIIESVQTGYPDCEGKRRVDGGKWQRVRIEFEFLSSRFDHDPKGCDLVVCWKHDREDCPVDVIELKDEIRKRRRS